MGSRKWQMAILLGLTATSCQTIYETAPVEIGQAEMVSPSGADVGTARLFSQAGNVSLSISLVGITSGTHAVQLRKTGGCSAIGLAAPLASGQQVEELPDVTISDAGIGTVSALLESEGDEVAVSIFGNDGSAIVILESEGTGLDRQPQLLACGPLAIKS